MAQTEPTPRASAARKHALILGRAINGIAAFL